MEKSHYYQISFPGLCINDCMGCWEGAGSFIACIAQPNMAKKVILDGILVQDRVKRARMPVKKGIDRLLVKDRVKRDDYDDQIKFKTGTKYDWKAHAKMANKMAAEWKHLLERV